MTSTLEALVPAINHGDGVCVDVPTEIPLPPARDYSPEELSAMAWKCRMQKSSPEIVRQLLQRLPEECILEMVEKFRERPVGVATKSATSRSYFILTRDSFKAHKNKCVQQMLDWTGVRYGESEHCGKMKMGKYRVVGSLPMFELTKNS